MDKVTYFKNFPMGTEIDIAGTFIYNGIKEFNRLKTFNYEQEVFHILYPISAGIERLQKVLIILLEDISLEEFEDFEKSLITHNHQELHNRIRQKYKIEFNSQQNSFLQLITNFYNSCRYSRFNLNGNYSRERDLLIKFITENLNIEITVDDWLMSTQNDEKIKSFFGRIVGSISRKYYEAIREQAWRLNIYTYELRSNSPAAKIFLPEFRRNSLQEQYINEQISLKEFLIFLINTRETSGFYEFIKSIKPLNIDIALAQEYLADICMGEVSQSLIDEVEFLYTEEVEDVKERLSCMEAVGNMSYIFDCDMEEYDDMEEIGEE